MTVRLPLKWQLFAFKKEIMEGDRKMKFREKRLFIIFMVLTLALVLPMSRIDDYSYAVSENASEQGKENSQSGKEKSEKQKEKGENGNSENSSNGSENSSNGSENSSNGSGNSSNGSGNSSNEGDNGNSTSWDKSSLVFNGGNGAECPEIYTQIKNGGSGNMSGSVDWKLFYAESGNPKNGEVVANGTFGPLDSGDSEELRVNLQDYHGEAGNYMFKAYQMDGHPGTGALWSDSIAFIPCYDSDDDSDDSDDDSDDSDDDSDDSDDDSDDSDDDSDDSDDDSDDSDDDSDDSDDDSDDSNDDDSDNNGNNINNNSDFEQEEINVPQEDNVPQGKPQMTMASGEAAELEVPVIEVPQALPNTGEESKNIFYFMGMLLIGLGLLYRRKAENQY